MKKEDLTNDQKIDMILKYARSERRWAIFRGVISFIFFLVFIVMPVIGGFFLMDYAQKNVNWTEWEKSIDQMKKQFKDLQNLGFQTGQFGADIQQQIQKTLPPVAPKK
ncbi:hypothetical protein HZA43_00145 [Candidatus Peregrinibacteria bacterium]|nr:hypothetical protein [Candidatus Peregrinibacteria bacterium]